MALVQQGIADWPADRSAVLGSSLGGFYATAVAQATGWPAVLLNPAVDPARDLAAYVGELTSFHAPEEHFFFRAEYIDELRQLAVPAITHPERFFAVIAKGDEVLDWREMTARYAGAQLRLLEGGDHALSDFDDHLPPHPELPAAVRLSRRPARQRRRLKSPRVASRRAPGTERRQSRRCTPSSKTPANSTPAA